MHQFRDRDSAEVATSPMAANSRGSRPAVPDPAHILGRLQRQVGNQAALGLLRNPQAALGTPTVPRIGREGGDLDPGSESILHRATMGGTAMDATLRRAFEGAFDGADFSGVRLHHDRGASELSDRLQAKAFTVGQHIFFGEGSPPVNSPTGRELLAHELTHTVQQSPDRVHRMSRRPTMIQRAPVETPFHHETILGHPDWHKEAERYERRLGSYLYGSPAAEKAAVAGLHTMQIVLQQYYQLSSAQSRELFAKNDPTSAGQVGEGRDQQALYELFSSGNLREILTAFYNAAYYKGGKTDPGWTLKAILNDLVTRGDMKKADDLGLNVEDLTRQAGYIGGTFRSASEWLISRVKPDKAYNFSSDVFALGNIAAQSANWKGDLAEITASQAPRSERSAEERLMGAEKKYPAQYRWMNAPLSDRELAFLKDNDKPLEVTGFEIVNIPVAQLQLDEQGEPTKAAIQALERQADVWSVEVHYEMEGGTKKLVEGKPVITDVVQIVKVQKKVEQPRAHDLQPGTQGPEFPIQWVEGAAQWKIDPDSSWFKKVHDELGMPVVAGVSGTTARMLKAFQWLNVPQDIFDFRMALMGWMLTSWDHSLYEILRGSHMAGVAGQGEAAAFTNAVSMYHHAFAPLTITELRDKVCENRMFPDEIIYDRLARADRKEGGLGEPGPAGVKTADRLAGKLKTAKVNEETGAGRVDPTVAQWLKTNNTSATEMYGRLSPAHFLALTAYTGAGHSMINLVVGSSSLGGGLVGQKAAPYLFERQLHNMINEELSEKKTSPEPLVPSLAGDPELRPLLKDYKAAKEDPGTRSALSVKMHQRVNVIAPKLFEEMKMHADMLVEALNLLPPAVGEVWRGDWKVGGVSDTRGKALSAMAGLFGTYGSRVIDINEFASTSRVQDKAMRFLKNYQSTSTSHPVLLHLKLKGGRGRDISMFSKIADEQEVLLMPGAKFAVKSSRIEDFDGKAGEVIEADEV